MWSRLFRELSIEIYWFKKNLGRSLSLNTPTGFMGILAIISGISLLIIVAHGLTRAFQTWIPWVSGSKAGEIYWSSIGFGIKASLIFMVFCTSLIIFIIMKFLRKY